MDFLSSIIDRFLTFILKKCEQFIHSSKCWPGKGEQWQQPGVENMLRNVQFYLGKNIWWFKWNRRYSALWLCKHLEIQNLMWMWIMLSKNQNINFWFKKYELVEGASYATLHDSAVKYAEWGAVSTSFTESASLPVGQTLLFLWNILACKTYWLFSIW